VQGANRLGGNALAETQVFGKRAGEAAGQGEKRVKKIDPAQLAEIRARTVGFLSGTTNPARVRKELQKMMWQDAGIFRDETKLRHALATAEQLLTAPIRAASPAGIAECCIVQNMCLTATLICRSALIRPESRGANMRVDLAQEWDAEHSPYSHTYISKNRKGIARHGVAA
jgi:fumarate reductase (CoM/CoB) subunit A